MALNWFKNTESEGDPDRDAEITTAPETTSARARVGRDTPITPSTDPAQSTPRLDPAAEPAALHPQPRAADPFDPLALEERLREARARRTEALARRKAGGSETPAPPGSDPVRRGVDATPDQVVQLRAPPAADAISPSEPPAEPLAATPPAPLVAPQRPAYLNPQPMRRTGRWILPLLFLCGIAIGGAGVFVAPDDLREDLRARVSAAFAELAAGTQVRDVSLFTPDDADAPAADPASAPPPVIEPVAETGAAAVASAPVPAAKPAPETAVEAETTPADPAAAPLEITSPPAVIAESAPDALLLPDVPGADSRLAVLSMALPFTGGTASPPLPDAPRPDSMAFRAALTTAPPAPPIEAPVAEAPPANVATVTHAPLSPTIAEAAPAPVVGRRVFLHAPASVSQDTLRNAIASLREAGFAEVRAIPVGFSIGKTNVRYYHAGDGSAAHRVAAVLNASLDIDPPRPRDFTHFTPAPLRGTLEVWLSGQTSARPAPPAQAGARVQSVDARAAAEIQALVESTQQERRQTIVRTRRVPDDPRHPFGRLGQQIDRAVDRFATGNN